MKGPFSLGGPKLNFKGEPTDPDDSRLELDAQPARLLPYPSASRASSHGRISSAPAIRCTVVHPGFARPRSIAP